MITLPPAAIHRHSRAARASQCWHVATGRTPTVPEMALRLQRCRRLSGGRGSSAASHARFPGVLRCRTRPQRGNSASRGNSARLVRVLFPPDEMFPR